MLVLSRKRNERIMIGPDIELTVVRIRDDKVRLGFKAPDSVKIMRSELLEPMDATDAAQGRATDGL